MSIPRIRFRPEAVRVDVVLEESDPSGWTLTFWIPSGDQMTTDTELVRRRDAEDELEFAEWSDQRALIGRIKIAMVAVGFDFTDDAPATLPPDPHAIQSWNLVPHD